MNGAPSVQMQEIPPDLMGFLASEAKSREEKEEARGNAAAGEKRDDGPVKSRELMGKEVGGVGDGSGSGKKRTRMF